MLSLFSRFEMLNMFYLYDKFNVLLICCTFKHLLKGFLNFPGNVWDHCSLANQGSARKWLLKMVLCMLIYHTHCGWHCGHSEEFAISNSCGKMLECVMW